MTAKPARQALPDRTVMSLSVETPDAEILVYNYDQIDPDYRQTVIDAAVDIKRHGRRAHESLIAIGKRLQQVKKLLPHGEFGKWIDTEFALSERMAQNMMNAAEVYGPNPQRVADFSSNAIYLLAAPSTPKRVRTQIEQESKRTGKPPTGKEVAQAIAEDKAQRQPQTPEDVSSEGYSIEYHERAQQYRWARHNSAGGAVYGPLRDTIDDAVADVWQNVERGVVFFEPEPPEYIHPQALKRAELCRRLRAVAVEYYAAIDEIAEVTGLHSKAVTSKRDARGWIEELSKYTLDRKESQ